MPGFEANQPPIEAQIPTPEVSLEDVQAATRERMVALMEQLVGDDGLRDVLARVGIARYSYPGLPEGRVEPWSDNEKYDLRAQHATKIYNLASYSDIEGLQRATNEIFNARSGGVERGDVDGAVYEDELDVDARMLAEKYGLTGDTLPPHDKYAVQVNLGAAADSLIDRQTYGSKIVPDLMLAGGRHLEVGMEFNLGSVRPVDAAERARSKPYAKEVVDEWGLAMNAINAVHGVHFSDRDILEGTDPSIISHVRRTVSGKEPMSEQETRDRYLALNDELSQTPADSRRHTELRQELAALQLPQPPNKWRVASGVAPDGHPVFALSSGFHDSVFGSADAKGKERRKDRPNTADTFALLGKMLKDDIKPGERALVVTHAQYTGSQGVDAEMLAYDLGLQVDVIGFDPSQFGGKPVETYKLLQEIHTKVNSTFRMAKHVGVL